MLKVSHLYTSTCIGAINCVAIVTFVESFKTAEFARHVM